MASEKQQAGRALRRLARRSPLVALAIAAVLVVGAALGYAALRAYRRLIRRDSAAG